MGIILRVILIGSLFLQSLPGLVTQRCVAMPTVSELAAAGMAPDAGCSCCGPSDNEAAVECPMAKNGYIGCNCKNPQPDEPKTPPANEKSRQLEQLFAAVTLVVAILVPEPAPVSVRWTDYEPPSRSGSHSIQSLLCVWLM